jgi:hypothetical protein
VRTRYDIETATVITIVLQINRGIHNTEGGRSMEFMTYLPLKRSCVGMPSGMV